MEDILEKFKILGLKPTLDLNKIKKNYYNKMKVFHPDKGGSETECKRIIDAYNFIIEYINTGNIQYLLDYFFSEISKFYNKKAYTKSYEIIESIEPYLSEQLNILIIASMVCYKLKNYEKAVEISKKGLEKFPNSITLYNNIAWFLGVGLQDYNNAFYYANRGLELDNHNPVLLDTIAYLYFLIDQFDKALFYAKKSLEIKPDLPYSLFILANFYFRYYNNIQIAFSLIKKAIYFEKDEEEREIFIDFLEELKLFKNDIVKKNIFPEI